MEFCCGCWLEGGAGFGDIFDGIRTFTAEDRILIVHFRNVTAPLPRFVETFLDNGYMDMYRVMKTFVQAGYRGTMILDHSPKFAGEYAKGERDGLCHRLHARADGAGARRMLNDELRGDE